MQFPFSFHYEVPSRRYLDRLCRSLEGLPVAVEFRNREWQRESVLRALGERGVAFVNVDQPDLPELMEASDAATADLAYIRFHGRNKANWWTGDNASRYDYLYSEQELEGWVERIRTILRRARTLLVAFNNHFRGQAVQNARTMKDLVAAARLGDADHEFVCQVLIVARGVCIFPPAHELVLERFRVFDLLFPGRKLLHGRPLGFRPPFPGGFFLPVAAPGV